MHSAHLLRRIYCRADVLKEPPVRAVIIVASLYWLQLSFNRRMLSTCCRHLSAAQTHNLEVPVSIEREREGGGDRQREGRERERERVGGGDEGCCLSILIKPRLHHIQKKMALKHYTRFQFEKCNFLHED